jgi:hypothetical protein
VGVGIIAPVSIAAVGYVRSSPAPATVSDDPTVDQLRALNDTMGKLLVSEQEARSEALRMHAETMCLFRVCPGSKAAANGWPVQRP